MRIYLPTTLGGLAQAHLTGEFAPGALVHAVTPAIREWYTEGAEEELEYVALSEAAEASLELLNREAPAQVHHEYRRVVVAADVPAERTDPDGAAQFRSAVRLTGALPLSAVASVHVDEASTQVRAAIVAALAALPAAAAGDDDAAFVLDEARSYELLWYDVTEIADLI